MLPKTTTGPVGSGQHTKMCNQLAIASGMIGVMESLLYARKAGLDPETVNRAYYISTNAPPGTKVYW